MSEDLYRYEYLVSADPEREASGVDSIIATEFIMAENEVDALIQAEQYDGSGVYGVRKANELEVIAYNAGFDTGHMFATARERMENDNGVRSRIDSFSVDSMSFTKLFNCGGCGKEFEFDDAVMIGENYLMRLVGENQNAWHVCIGCV